MENWNNCLTTDPFPHVDLELLSIGYKHLYTFCPVSVVVSFSDHVFRWISKQSEEVSRWHVHSLRESLGGVTCAINSPTHSPHDTVFLTTEGDTLAASTLMDESQSLTDFFIQKNCMSQSAKVGSQINAVGELSVTRWDGEHPVPFFFFFAVHVRVI